MHIVIVKHSPWLWMLCTYLMLFNAFIINLQSKWGKIWNVLERQWKAREIHLRCGRQNCWHMSFASFFIHKMQTALVINTFHDWYFFAIVKGPDCNNSLQRFTRITCNFYSFAKWFRKAEVCHFCVTKCFCKNYSNWISKHSTSVIGHTN